MYFDNSFDRMILFFVFFSFIVEEDDSDDESDNEGVDCPVDNEQINNENKGKDEDIERYKYNSGVHLIGLPCQKLPYPTIM